MTKKTDAPTQPQNLRVWIELPPPESTEQAAELCRLVNAMLMRLVKVEHLTDGTPQRTFFYDERERAYCYGGDMGYYTLLDRGQWFNLPYLAGEE